MPADLRGCPLLAAIPPGELRRDCPTARIATIRHRGTIYRQGQQAGTIFCVLEGQVTLSRDSAGGATITTAALSAGDFFGAALGGASLSEDTARAKGTAVVWRAPLEEFRRLLQQHPKTSWEFVATL